MRQFRVLYREFLFRLVDLETISGRGDMTKLIGQFLSLLVFVGILLTIPAMTAGAPRTSPLMELLLRLGFEHFLIATTMLAVGLFAVLCWDSAFPERRDVMVLAPLPIPARTLFAAKIAAVATGLVIVVAVLHLFAGLAWPLVLGGHAEEQRMPTLMYDPPLAPLDAGNLESVLRRDLDGALPSPNAGVVIGVSKRGKRGIFAFGTARPDSIFEIGSITKPLTGLILARMIHDGRVRLDEPVRELLPPGAVARPAPPEITLLDLVTHRSGLPRNPGNLRPLDKNNPAVNYTVEDLYAFVARHGVRRESNSLLYSNLGFSLLGQALAERASAPYSELLASFVTGPLGMRDTVVALSSAQRARLMQGHDAAYRPYASLDLGAMVAAGGVRSTAADMLTLLEANLHPRSAGSLAGPLAASQRIRARIVPGTSIAFAWAYFEDSRSFSHNGGTGGYSASAFFQPKMDTAAIVLLNARPGPIPFVDVLSEHVRQRLAGEPAVSLATVPVPARGGIAGRLRTFAAYWITMFAAGAFLFCSVLAAQGVAAQLLPRRWFLRVSSAMQLAAFALFVSVYFLQPLIAHPGALRSAQGGGWLSWSPSYWFLGFFQQLDGSPVLAPLARRAWIGLACAASLASVSWILAYWRTVRRIVEEPDIVPAVRGLPWATRFGRPFVTAVVWFAIRALFRSRWHRLLLAFYFGVAMASVVFLVRAPASQRYFDEADPWHAMSVPWIAASLVVLGFSIVGMRVVFSIPLDPRANWIFQTAAASPGRALLAARRLAMWLLSTVPVCLGSLAVFLSIWPAWAALEHAAVLALLGAVGVEVCLRGTPKIPFACTYLPGQTNVHLTFWLCLGLVLSLIASVAYWERQALASPGGFAVLLAALAAVAIALRLWNESNARASAGVSFEDEGDPAVMALGLNRDGAPALR